MHLKIATKISYGWIKRGVDKPIAQTAVKTRVNVNNRTLRRSKS